MALVLRATKGSALTHTEADDNFTELGAKSDQNILDIAALDTRVGTNETDIDDLQTQIDNLPGASGAASTTNAGVVRLTTIAEAEAGAADNIAVTPAGLQAALDAAGGTVAGGIAGTAASNFVAHTDTSGVGSPSFTFPGTTDDVYMITYGYAQGGVNSAPGTVQDDNYLFTGTIKGSQTIIGADATKFEILAVKLA